jgi:Tol biopolymer transport system component
MPSSIDCVGTGRPAWSHDGGRLAVVCLNASSRSTSLRTVTLDGEVSDPIVTSSMLRESPTWTGHDTVIYGEFEEDRGPVTLMEVPADGSGDPEVLMESEGYWVSQLDWSDKGLLFVRSNAYAASGDIWLLDNDGGLTQYSKSGDITSVSWSPDGRSAVFTTGASPSARDQTLWVRRGDGSPKELARGPFGPPSWASR